jgi:Flp pilus assembly protein CpaB
MEMEYKDPSKKGRWIVLLGVVLALVAGASAFFLINNAQQQAGTTGLKLVEGYVAARPILARQAIVAEDIVMRKDIPLDNTNAGVVTDPKLLVGRLVAVDVAQGQLLTTNLLASGTAGLGFAILRPDETVAPDSEAWRAVSITVSDDRAVGGVLGAGMSVDVFVTATVTVPEEPPVVSGNPGATAAPAVSALKGFETGRSTKITYQGMTILARTDTYYILKTPLVVAEEISHMQADGAAQFSLALRPDQDLRVLDVSALGATTNRIIERYGLPIPQPYPAPNGPKPSNPPIPAITPPPSPTVPPAQPGASAAPSAAPGS